MHTPQILVLLSAYNGARYLSEQLHSIWAQRGVEVYVAVRDDGSTDNTADIVAQHAEAHPGRVCLLRGENMGFARSFWQLMLWAGTHLPQCSYVALADQDDVWLEGKLARACACIRSMDEGAGRLYCSDLIVTDAALQPLHRMHGQRALRPTVENALMESHATGCTMVMDRKLLALATKHTPPVLCAHDLWLYHVAVLMGSFLYDTEAHILYRQHGSNEIGAKATFGEKVRRKYRSLTTLFSQHYREEEARALLACYAHMLPTDALRALRVVECYRRNWKVRLRWLMACGAVERKLSMTRPQDDFFLKLRVLLGCV